MVSHNAIMDTHNAVMDIQKLSRTIDMNNSIMAIHNSIMGIHNPSTDIRDYCRWFIGLSSFPYCRDMCKITLNLIPRI